APDTPITTTVPRKSGARVVAHAPDVRRGAAAGWASARPARRPGRGPAEPAAPAGPAHGDARTGTHAVSGRFRYVVARQAARPAARDDWAPGCERGRRRSGHANSARRAINQPPWPLCWGQVWRGMVALPRLLLWRGDVRHLPRARLV